VDYGLGEETSGHGGAWISRCVDLHPFGLDLQVLDKAIHGLFFCGLFFFFFLACSRGCSGHEIIGDPCGEQAAWFLSDLLKIIR
jgi:hypothetical protein